MMCKTISGCEVQGAMQSRVFKCVKLKCFATTCQNTCHYLRSEKNTQRKCHYSSYVNGHMPPEH